MLVFEKLKKLFQRKKPEDGLEEDDFLEEAEEKETDADISYTDDEEPEEQAKTIKKKAIMVAGGAAVLFAVSAIASNVFLGGSGKGNSDKALSGPVSAATPADKLPDKYSDIDKDKKQNTATPHTGQTTPANSPGRTTVSEGSRTPSTSAAVPVNTSRTTGVSSMPAAVPVMPTGNGAASRGESSAAQAAAKEKEAADSSELAFKVAANISQQQAEKSAVQPLADAASMGSGIVQTASYSNPMASTYRSSLVVDAGSYVLSAGAVIQATLLTGVTSDVAHGDVVAQVRQNIYDSLTGTHLLIPQGSRVIGIAGHQHLPDLPVDRRHHRPQAALVGLADRDLHRVATAGAQAVIKKLGSDPVFDGFEQRMAQVILLMAFQTNQVGLKGGQPKRATANHRMVGMRQTATVGCQPVRQPVVRLM